MGEATDRARGRPGSAAGLGPAAFSAVPDEIFANFDDASVAAWAEPEVFATEVARGVPTAALSDARDGAGVRPAGHRSCARGR
jgi:hypothetical protein